MDRQVIDQTEINGHMFSLFQGSMHDVKDFYKKHHTWSEGLISAAKQVGHGASLVVYVSTHFDFLLTFLFFQ